MRKPRGLVHVYTGNGKGKTTAALGLVLRASGAGFKTCVHQFIKGTDCGELKSLKRLCNVTVRQCGRRSFIMGKPDSGDIVCAKKGFERACLDIFSGNYGLIVLDEINVAMHFGLVKTGDLIEIIENKPDSLELVLTGRRCPGAIIKLADLVTEMRQIRHPYNKGLKARKGIEF